MSIPVVAIVGRPNVGKSTIFNRIAGDRISIVEDTPGVTRDRIYAHGEWLGTEFSMIDTGGIDIGDEPFLKQITEQAEIAIDEADVIVFVVSAREGLADADERVAKILYRADKPVILAVNKLITQSNAKTFMTFTPWVSVIHTRFPVRTALGLVIYWMRLFNRFRLRIKALRMTAFGLASLDGRTLASRLWLTLYWAKIE